MAPWTCFEHGALADDGVVEVEENERGERLPLPVKACAKCRRPVLPARDAVGTET